MHFGGERYVLFQHGELEVTVGFIKEKHGNSNIDMKKETGSLST